MKGWKEGKVAFRYERTESPKDLQIRIHVVSVKDRTRTHRRNEGKEVDKKYNPKPQNFTKAEV